MRGVLGGKGRGGLLALLALPLVLACGAQQAYAEPLSAPAVPGGSPAAAVAVNTLVLIGDTQRTTWMERLIGREQNEAGRQALIEKLVREERPAFIVHLGDLVSFGHSSEEWEYFDRLVAAVGVPIHPVLGNHDYWGPDWLALRNARERFPELAPLTYRTLRLGPLGLVLVDSNLDGQAAAEQARWFAAALSAFDRDPSVRAVLAFTHHPPFTNGEGRQDDAAVASALLPAFLASPKALLLASGHVHGYERFELRRKTFLVSGGGGGPRVEYRVGKRASHPAAYAAGGVARRPFHYVVIEQQPLALQVTVKCLVLDPACPGGLLETFAVPLPAQP
jgi:hypothetical protein